MSTKKIADKVASKGRYGDTEIVHMAPWEIEALRSLSPTGELTINPSTGKPEAFIFGLLAPLLGSTLGIGGGLLATAGLGAAGGALDALLAGEDPLTGAAMGGLMGGLGGSLFGTGNAASSIASNASKAAAAQPWQAVTSAITPAATQGAAAAALPWQTVTKGVADAANPGILGGIGSFIEKNPMVAAMGGLGLASMLGGSGGATSSNSKDDKNKPGIPENRPTEATIKSFNDPSGGNPAWWGNYSNSRTSLPPLGEADFIRRGRGYAMGGPISPMDGSITPGSMAPVGREFAPGYGPAPMGNFGPPRDPVGGVFANPAQISPGANPYAQGLRSAAIAGFTPFAPSPQPQVATQPQSQPMFQPMAKPQGIANPLSRMGSDFFTLRDASKLNRDNWINNVQGGRSLFRRKFAEGGPIMDPMSEEIPAQGDDKMIVKSAMMALMGKHPQPDEAIRAFVARFGEAALSDLQQRVSALKPGGGIAGPGDGMSDSIPAAINGAEPAALSDGEYVVPADVVSGLGNGSTDAGIKQLDGLQQRVRMARGGPVMQPPQINPRQVLPA